MSSKSKKNHRIVEQSEQQAAIKDIKHAERQTKGATKTNEPNYADINLQ